jgi:hypothetical protein
MLNLIDEFTRECLAIRVGRKLKSADVIDVLSDQFRGVPEHISSDNRLACRGQGRRRELAASLQPRMGIPIWLWG